MHRGLIMATIVACGVASAQDLKLPDPLVMQDGRAVTSAEMWTKERRPELVELFRTNVYGRVPNDASKSHAHDLDITPIEGGELVREEVVFRFRNRGKRQDVHLHVVRPKNVTQPMPVFLLINHRDLKTFDPTQDLDNSFWPARQIVARGYIAAILQAQDVDPDADDGFKDGVHGVFDDPSTPRAGDAWGTIAAWAWGASRAMDYFEIDRASGDIFDEGKVAVLGHSRGGKTALWCGAQDERFALTISNESGCTGAALSRRPVGETTKQINDRFPHWFCTNYRNFNDREANLPIDQHELIALMAPRLVYVASASEDNWADPEGEFLSCVHASPVYKLLGVPGLEETNMPSADAPIHRGNIGYHLRTGKHELTAYDWNCFMDFADKHWK